jgi:hypothetical protein
MKFVPETLNELQKFQRGQDPRKSMDVGMNPLVKEIDGHDLFLLFQITDQDTGKLKSFEEFITLPYYEGSDPEMQEELYERGKRYYELLSGVLHWYGPIESVEEFEEAERKAKGKYLYDFTPDGDNINIVISDIELPSAGDVDKELVGETIDWLEIGNRYNYGTPKTYESVNFERRSDPKRAMRVGNVATFNGRDVELFEEIHEFWENVDTWPKEFESVSPINWDSIIPSFKVDLKSYGDEDNSYKVLLSRKRGVEMMYLHFVDAGGGRRSFRKEEYNPRSFEHFMRILESNHTQTINIEESVNFERGKDPKRKLQIGKSRLIPEITSEDLEAIETMMDDNGIKDFEEFIDFHGIDIEHPDDLEEAKRDYERFSDILIVLEGEIEFGEYKDWKEFDEVRDYLKHNTPEDKPYVYNAFPGGDGIQIIFSSIELPSAEEIDPDDDAFDPD